MLNITIKYTKCINSRTRWIYNSLVEDQKLQSLPTLLVEKPKLEIFLFKDLYKIKTKIEEAHCVWKDMLHLITMWRQIRGYPQHGSTTHTNARTPRKNKTLLLFRIKQFTREFGEKKRNIYPTLVKAEYTNRLWYYSWFGEWIQAFKFAQRMAKTKGKSGIFNPVLLAGHQTNGYTRVGQAAKIGKAKKLTKVFTIGVPLFFTRFIYYEKIPKGFSTRLILREEVNKKLGKRIRKKK